MAVMTAMSGAKKAAILTLLLGEEQASGVLKGRLKTRSNGSPERSPPWVRYS